MSKFATSPLILIVSLALLLAGGSPVADEPADEPVPASADSSPGEPAEAFDISVIEALETAAAEPFTTDATGEAASEEVTGEAAAALPAAMPGKDAAEAAAASPDKPANSAHGDRMADRDADTGGSPAAGSVGSAAVVATPPAGGNAGAAADGVVADPVTNGHGNGLGIEHGIEHGQLEHEPSRAVAQTPSTGPEDGGVAVDTLSDEPVEQGPAVPLADAVTVADETMARTLTLLGADVPPGTYQRLSWSATEMFEDLPVSTPVLVVNGRAPGPTVCLTAAVHGDELNGIEMVRRVMHDLNPKNLAGAVIGVPIVNLQGFRRGSRYLPDRRDLNRYFPGNPRGSAASRIAHSFFAEVIEHCDALIDLHTGSFDRANLPQLRADLRNPDVVTLTHGFGATVILHSDPAEGTLRHAATAAGIATVTLEAGGPSQLELKEVMHGVKGIETLLNTLGMVDKIRLWGDQQPVYYRSSWVRANRGGILLADVSLGSTVRRGDLLGTITDPMNNASTNLYSPYSGRVIGMARNQVVMPGFAAFHVGIQTVDASTVENDAHDRQSDEALAHESETNSDDYVDGMSE